MKIDWWTLGLQAINVMLLLWVLQRFLFKPVQAVIARRQQDSQRLMAEAMAARDSAVQMRTALEAERAAGACGREQALAAVQAEARKAREALLLAATQEVQQRAAAAQAALELERTEAATALRTQAAELAGSMARHLLERLPAATWNRHFLEQACGELARLAPQEARQTGSVHIITADALASEDQAWARQTLGTALGQPVSCDFAVDARLIAGVELHFSHLVVRNHWAGDLEHILNTLPHDDAPADPA